MSSKNTSIKLFEEKQVRAVWDEQAEKWWFSVLDVISILTDQPDYAKTRNYWKWLKKKLADEGSQLVSDTTQLKMKAADGKFYKTDAANTELVLNMLAEVAATDISIERQPSGLAESAQVAQEGAKAAKVARKQIEQSTGKPVVSRLNAKNLQPPVAELSPTTAEFDGGETV